MAEAAPATVKGALAAIDDFYTRRGLGPANAERAELPQLARHALDQRAARRWLRAVEAHLSQCDRAIVGILFYAGARISEAVGPDVDDVRVSARKGVLRLLGKGEKVREVPIDSQAAPRPHALARGSHQVARGRRHAGPLPQPAPRPASAQAASGILATLADAAGQEDTTMACVLPTFGTQLVRPSDGGAGGVRVEGRRPEGGRIGGVSGAPLGQGGQASMDRRVDMADLQIRPLEETTWPDFARLVEAHYGLRGGCWCMAFHAEGVDRTSPAQNRSEKERRVREGQAHAALVYDGPACVGWCQFGPTDELPRIKHRRAYLEGLDVLPDWRITCFFVDRKYRRRGVTAAALEGALREIARLWGGTVEGYPEDTAGRMVSDAFLNNGTVSMFERKRFARTRRLGEHHWVVARVVP